METKIMKQLKTITAFHLAVMFATMLGCASTSQKAPTATTYKESTSASRKESAGEYLDDSVITTRVKAAVFNEPTLKSSEINVETFKGVVQLSGFVNSQADINKAVDIARSIKGVTSVQNDMQLKTK
jgi:osmotically-inducible protein OsmY